MDKTAWLESRWNPFMEDLVTLIRIPSVTHETGDPACPFGEPCARVLDAIMRIGNRMGFETRNHEGYCATLLWKGETEEEIGIFAHLDVVPEGTGWTGDPYEPILLHDKLIARGSSDDKGPALSALYALLYLKESGYRPRHSIRFFFGVNEEAGMKDIDYYVEHMPMPAFSFTPDASFPVCYGEKGILGVRAKFDLRGSVLRSFVSGVASNAVPAHAEALLSVPFARVSAALSGLPDIEVAEEAQGCRVIAHGIAAHAAFPEGSRSAQVILCQALLRLPDLDEKARRFANACCSLFADTYGAGLGVPLEDAVSGKLTHVGGMVLFADGEAEQDINIRYPVTADRDAMKAAITSCLEGCGFTGVTMKDSAPSYVDKDSPAVVRLTQIANRVLGTDLPPFTMGGGTYARHLRNAVGYGPGLRGTESEFGPSRGKGHQPDEYVTYKKLKDGFAVYAEAIPALDEII
ncbi:MAG: Sapep family Mn(2+)-dependent dipeptidase [Clostridia bacterium]|nr:Sapep family Mn(2+)-dependent dipeptidase [Clostridia bacterium]